uniref:TIR domain-containing protein n=1 Tax=Esox lucius TaxID=8010 RepID=A0AAY5K3I3_ESOLU
MGSGTSSAMFLCFLHFFWIIVNPARAYSMKHCISIKMNLNCRQRNLQTIPSDIPPVIKSLDVSMNNISKIKKSDFKNISVINCMNLSSNTISNVEDGAFLHLVALHGLDLGHNKLTTISEHMFQGLANMTRLQLHNNLISFIACSSFQNLSGLQIVNLTNNKLHHLSNVQPLVHLPNLRELYISNNNLHYFESRELSNGSIGLKVLDVSTNPLERFSITANVLPNLQNLNLSYCGQNGSMEWDVADTVFLSKISTLDLSGVQMSVDNMSMVLQNFTNTHSSLASLALSNLWRKSTEKVGIIANIACHIPTLSVLRLGNDCISVVSEKLLQSCSRTKKLDLSDNIISDLSESSFRSLKGLKYIRLDNNSLSSVPNATRNLSTLKILDLSLNSIDNLNCLDFANLTGLLKLFLYSNKIQKLDSCVFQDLKSLKMLSLGGNSILTLNGAFTNCLQNLESLDLRQNKLSSIKQEDFKQLKSLKSLILFDNQISHMDNGAFDGLFNLETLKLSSNKINAKAVKDTVFRELSHLRYLSISSNRIEYEHDSELRLPPFVNLSSLRYLAIFSQNPQGMFNIPSNFLEGLQSLETIRAGNLNIKLLHPNTFRYTPELKYLDISDNKFTSLTAELFHPIPKLMVIYLSKCQLESLDFLINANLFQVNYLQISYNQLTALNETLLNSLPSLTYMDMRNNSFSCNCSNLWFMRWITNNSQTQVVDAHQYLCKYPFSQKGTLLLDFDTHSCSVDTGLFYFISTTSLVLLTLLGSLIYRLLRWQLIYSYHLFLAYLYDNKQKNRRAAYQYDAFVSYNTHDEPWVLRDLLPELEVRQGWRLCLHHRDFQPGKPIMENITDAIYGSHKTICVISRHYLESEWCSREIQVARWVGNNMRNEFCWRRVNVKLCLPHPEPSRRLVLRLSVLEIC